MSETKYTIFATCGSAEGIYYSGDSSGSKGTLDQIVAHAGGWPGPWTLYAWCEGIPQDHDKGLSELRADSIAAGRVIEYDILTNTWVARGVEEKKDEPEDNFVWLLGPMEDGDANAAMIARDTKFSTPVHISETGKVSVKPSDVIAHPKFQSDLQVVKKLREAHPPIAGLSVSTESLVGHRPLPHFGSAFLRG
jgi:hypothetical protein